MRRLLSAVALLGVSALGCGSDDASAADRGSSATGGQGGAGDIDSGADPGAPDARTDTSAGGAAGSETGPGDASVNDSAGSDGGADADGGVPAHPRLKVEILRPLVLSASALIPSQYGLVSADVAADRLAFEFGGPVPPIGAGSVLVGSEGGGYLRRVRAVLAGSAGRLELETEPAELVDLVLDGHFKVRYAPTTAAEGLGNDQSAQIESFVEFLTGQNLASGCHVGSGLSVEPRLGVVPVLDLEFDIRLSRLEHALFRVGGRIEQGLDIELFEGARLSCDYDLLAAAGVPEKERGKEFTLSFPVGIVPVRVTFGLGVVAGTTLDLSLVGARARVEQRDSAGLSLGVEYDPARGWRLSADAAETGNIDLTVAPSRIAYDGRARLEGGIRFSTKLWDTLGPYIDLQHYFEGRAMARSETCWFDAALTEGKSVTAGVLAEVPFLDESLAVFQDRIVLAERTIASSAGAIPLCELAPVDTPNSCASWNDIASCEAWWLAGAPGGACQFEPPLGRWRIETLPRGCYLQSAYRPYRDTWQFGTQTLVTTSGQTVCASKFDPAQSYRGFVQNGMCVLTPGCALDGAPPCNATSMGEAFEAEGNEAWYSVTGGLNYGVRVQGNRLCLRGGGSTFRKNGLTAFECDGSYVTLYGERL